MNVLFLRKHKLKYFEVKKHHVCNLFSNGLKKKCVCIYTERKRERMITVGKITGEYKKGVQEFFVLFLEHFSKSEFTSK